MKTNTSTSQDPSREQTSSTKLRIKTGIKAGASLDGSGGNNHSQTQSAW